jgi:uncharacterized protein involved in response to NO
MDRPVHPFLSYAFRPFFLLNAFFAITVVITWVFALRGHGPARLPADTMLWHGHEMLVGFAMATIAGFVLTAVATWTSRPAVNGSVLVMLIAAWLAGRLVMIFASAFPGWLVAVIDMAFPVLLCVLAAREIFGAGNRRNYPIVGVILLLAVLNLVYHLGSMQVISGADRMAIHLLMHTVLLLITVIGGRVVPNFTANWLRTRGAERLPASHVIVDGLTVVLTIAVGVVASFGSSSKATGGLALATAALHAIRLGRWCGFATMGEPLLFVLHVAYAWLPIGYALMGLVALNWVITPTAALHALTMGAIGSMILAMTTRVPLGHTGRPLTASRLTVIAYLALTIAVLVRVGGPLLFSDYLATIEWSAAFWIVAFALFIGVYWPILTRPPTDGD